ncbi:MAG: N-acetylmuramoyl-L-alanine amidase [Rhodospirillaceae bacterium]|nr:N-acetylmuramoyl-L-alanine amidase [Rhodospirillaceae bacterium]
MRIVDRPSPNHNERPGGRAPDMLVLHYTGMQSAAGALDRLCDPAAQVSAHYTVDEDGTVYAHVPEERRAWHAGVAYWQGETDVNGRSVGIEIVNPGHEFGYRPFPAMQMTAVAALSGAIVSRYGIRPLGVVGHSDVAPERKTDPGELFDWRMLAAAGVGYWPGAGAVRERIEAADAADLQALGRNLGRIGYRWPDAPDKSKAEEQARTAVVAAFQRHFRPASVTGAADPETAALAAVVAAAA